jgi:hypothetical protein
VAATILEVAGLGAPEGHPLMGASLRSETARDAGRAIVFHHAEGRRRYLAALGHGHKFIHWFNGGDEELYDLGSDHWEQRNLVYEAASRELADLLRRACAAFERDHGVAANVQGDALVDLPYVEPPANYCTLYPDWSYRQFPRWMNGYSQSDLELIAAEMRGCLQSDVLTIPADPRWRAEALAHWQRLGGDPSVYRAIFGEVDARRSSQ